MLVLLSTSISFGQNLKQHQWEQRVLIVASKQSDLLERQIDSLNQNLLGLEERKLVIYQVTPMGYTVGVQNDNFVPTARFYRDIRRTKKDFEVILIGLDGGVKLRQTELLTLEKLFTLIDGMPMRRSEIRNKYE